MKYLAHGLLMLCAWVWPTASSAQLGDLINAVKATAKQGVNTATLGTKPITEAQLVGTWNYAEPEVVFESSNPASQLGGALAANEVKRKISAGLAKSGFSPSKASITFKGDGTYIASMNGKSISGKYSVKGTNLTFDGPLGVEQVAVNVRLVNQDLQLAVKADKFLTLIQSMAAVPANSTVTLQAVSSLLKNYSGVQFGLVFRKTS